MLFLKMFYTEGNLEFGLNGCYYTKEYCFALFYLEQSYSCTFNTYNSHCYELN